MPVASIGMLSVVGQTLGPGEKHVSENESLWRVTTTGGLHSIKGVAHMIKRLQRTESKERRLVEQLQHNNLRPLQTTCLPCFTFCLVGNEHELSGLPHWGKNEALLETDKDKIAHLHCGQKVV